LHEALGRLVLLEDAVVAALDFALTRQQELLRGVAILLRGARVILARGGGSHGETEERQRLHGLKGVLHRKVLLWRGSIPRAADDGLLDDAFFTRLRIDLDLLLGDVLLDDVELDASVLLTTLFGVVARDGVVRAEALRREHLLGDALGDEISTDRL